jgi:hypothetical protein
MRSPSPLRNVPSAEISVPGTESRALTGRTPFSGLETSISSTPLPAAGKPRREAEENGERSRHARRERDMPLRKRLGQQIEIRVDGGVEIAQRAFGIDLDAGRRARAGCLAGQGERAPRTGDMPDKARGFAAVDLLHDLARDRPASTWKF